MISWRGTTIWNTWDEAFTDFSKRNSWLIQNYISLTFSLLRAKWESLLQSTNQSWCSKLLLGNVKYISKKLDFLKHSVHTNSTGLYYDIAWVVWLTKVVSYFKCQKRKIDGVNGTHLHDFRMAGGLCTTSGSALSAISALGQPIIIWEVGSTNPCELTVCMPNHANIFSR